MGKTISDRIEKLTDDSLIQHGPFNDRIYLMKIGLSNDDSLPRTLIAMARKKNYSKIFAKIPVSLKMPFEVLGFTQQAIISGFYNGDEPGLFMGYYLGDSRAIEQEYEKLNAIQKLAEEKAQSPLSILDTQRFKIRFCQEKDAEVMADIYRQVFPTYPFPIHESDYLLKTMRSHVAYFGIEEAGKLVALSSAEMDKENSNVEMTDFATLPQWRGNSLAIHLLGKMEDEMQMLSMKLAYTIARSYSPGMNITFSKKGYHFGGRLKNNTNIFNRMESMNVWYKTL